MNTVIKSQKRIAILALFLILPCLLSSCSSEFPFYTEDIAHYTDPESDIDHDFYLASIPNNALAVFYCSYEYWYDASETYLELKFNSVEEMQSYLDEVKAHNVNSSRRVGLTEEELLIQAENPYDKSYVDLIHTDYSIYIDKTRYTGYEFEDSSEGKFHIFSNFAVISYSYENLIVIQTAISGHFESGCDDYIPKYFRRFNIPLEPASSKKYILKGGI